MDKLKFIVEKNLIYGTLMQLSRVLRKSNGNRNRQVAEFTIVNNKLIINVPGATLDINVISEGGAKFTTNIIPFSKALNVFDESILEFTLYNNQLSCGAFRLNVLSTFFNDDKVLRKIDLPLNYKKEDLIKLLSGKYTKEELAFNELDELCANIDIELKENIFKVSNILAPYGIKYEKIKQLIEDELKIGTNVSGQKDNS